MDVKILCRYAIALYDDGVIVSPALRDLTVRARAGLAVLDRYIDTDEEITR
jgi:hypothetical protein